MRFLPELPLLRRELTELANRRRTYVVRVVGASVILFFVFIAYKEVMAQRMATQASFGPGGFNRFLGIGGAVFSHVTPTLFYAIQILMPALCCACITSEKESNTIGTLLLTRLSPGTIIMEKFFSRLVPMLTLLLLTFPVLAHVYSMGGVDTDMLVGTLWLLLCECFLFASIAIMCSAWFSTTVSAFTVSYALTGILTMLSMSLELRTFVPSAIWHSFYTPGRQLPISESSTVVMAFLSGLLNSFSWAGLRIPAGMWLMLVVKSIPALVATAVFLLLARLFLVRRAFVTHSSVLIKAFKVVDVFFKELNDRTTGGIELIKDSNTLPDNDPVVWREQNKKSLGKARYLFRILVAVEAPTLFICMMAATLSARNAFEGLYFLESLIWIFSALVVCVKGATLFSSERANQTIEPLLATPMTANEMLDQKVRGMRRLLIVLSVPVMSVNFTHFVLNVNFSLSAVLSPVFMRAMLYLVLSACNTMVLLYLLTWASAGIGLRIHSQTKAVLTSVTVIAAWCALPVVFIVLTLNSDAGFVLNNLFLMLSPVSVVAFTESWLREPFMNTFIDPLTGERFEPWYIIWALAAVCWHAVVVLVLRSVVRANGPELLGRRESPNASSPADFAASHHVVVLEGSHS